MRATVLTVAAIGVFAVGAAGQGEPPFRLPDRVRTYYGPPRQQEPAPAHLAVSADGRKLYTIGGQSNESFELGDLPRVRGYDLATGRWTHALVASGDKLLRSDGTAVPRPIRGQPDVRFRSFSF